MYSSVMLNEREASPASILNGGSFAALRMTGEQVTGEQVTAFFPF